MNGGFRFKVDCSHTPWSVTSSAMGEIRKQWYAYGGSAILNYSHGSNTLEVILHGCDPLHQIAFSAAVQHWFSFR